jgi:phytoene dehydrogenase-like protein
MSKKKFDVIIFGGGHNGLVSAAILARKGLQVLLLEGKEILGGACRTEYPFKVAPQLGASTGAYLLGPMPPEILDLLKIKLEWIPRDPFYFLPTRGTRSLLLGSDSEENKRQFLKCFSKTDWEANCAMQKDLEMIRNKIGHTWLSEPKSVIQTATDCFSNNSDQMLFRTLCEGSVMQFLNRYGFKSNLLKAMYAVTDGLIGAYASWDTPGTGHNFLVHNMCRLPGSNGNWMLVKGGMGAVIQELVRVANEAGVTTRNNSKVSQLIVENGKACGVILESKEEIYATSILASTDPFTMRKIVGDTNLPTTFIAKLDEYATKPGATMKINLCLSDLPTFTCLPENRGQFRTTTHLLPDEDEVLGKIYEAFEFVKRGELPPYPLLEWYTHTALDPSLRDSEGRHNAALFVQLVPNRITNGSWEDSKEDYVRHILRIVDEFAPGTSKLVLEHCTFTPEGIENHFGISGGHILHIDHCWKFDERLPYRSPISGLYFGSAACYPGGGVTGAPGYNAANALLSDLDLV